MTAVELRDYFNNEYGLSKPWPEFFEVDEETFNSVIEHILLYAHCVPANFFEWEKLGKVMFKNVELRLKK